MRRSVQWMMVPRWWVGLTATMYIGVIGLVALAKVTIPLGAEAFEGLNVGGLLQFILIAFMAMAGIMRLALYHPGLNLSYTRWLATTPWTCRQRLPMGPLHLTWQDLLLLAGVFLLDRFHVGQAGAAPLLAFLLCFLGTTIMAHAVTRPNSSTLVLLFGLPAMLLLWAQQWDLVAAATILYAIAAVGTRASLRHFPWRILTSHSPSPVSAGWPHNRIGPLDFKARFSMMSAVAASLWLAWVVFCVAVHLDFPGPREIYEVFQPVVIFAGAVAAATRLIVYLNYGFPPISLLGRIATGRLIIPGFDQILVAPFVIVLVAIGASRLLLGNLYPPLACAIITFVIVLPGLALGPSLGRWRLTGTYRVPRPRVIPQPSSRRGESGNIQLQFWQDRTVA